jgi:uncharacterized membrane-anchored protein
MKYFAPLLFVSSIWLTLPVSGVDAPKVDAPKVDAPKPDKPEPFALKTQTGSMTIGNGIAKLNLGPNFVYIDPANAEKLLTEGWGNPAGNNTLGMILPAKGDPLGEDSWGVVISFDEDGYVEDKDANKIDYTDMLKEMKESTAEDSKERVKQGQSSIELVGWAEPPSYDQSKHLLYWAKELKFGGNDENTLNYNIRVLGRRGVLVLNAVAAKSQLGTIRKEMATLQPMVAFEQGHRYSDFVPSADKVAAYGIGALIAGKVASKVGLLAILGKFGKVGILALFAGGSALFGFVKKMFGKKEPQPTQAD